MFAADHSLFTSQADRDVRADHVPRHETSFPLPRHAGACPPRGDAGPARRRMSMPRPARPNMATVTPSARWAQTAQKQDAGRLKLGPELSAVRIGLSEARQGRSLPRYGELAFRAPARHRGLEPGTWKDPDPRRRSSRGSGAQHRPACPAMAATRRLRAIPSQRLPGAMVSGVHVVL